MKSRTWVGAAMMVAVAIGLVGTTGLASAAPPSGTAYTCTGGDRTGSDPSAWTFVSIPSGNYSSLTVAGVCQVPSGAVINVSGSVNLAPGAVLDGQTFTSAITVGQNLTAGSGSLLALGCQPMTSIGMFAGVPCADNPDGQTVITVNGNITTTNATYVALRKLTINGNVTLTGGGGGVDNDDWSIKGNTIGGNVTISGVTTDWLGVQFNSISNNATLTNITATDFGDPGRAVAVVQNTVGQNLNCSGLAPAVSGGFFGKPNLVGKKATGQCADISTPS
jgi:hypothetical protein